MQQLGKWDPGTGTNPIVPVLVIITALFAMPQATSCIGGVPQLVCCVIPCSSHLLLVLSCIGFCFFVYLFCICISSWIWSSLRIGRSWLEGDRAPGGHRNLKYLKTLRGTEHQGDTENLEYLKTLRGTEHQGDTVNPSGYYEYPGVSLDIPGYPGISLDPRISRDIQGLPGYPGSCHLEIHEGILS